MTASATAADPAGLPTPARRRHLARGMAAAGALSVAVHAAVLIASARSGSSSATGAPPAAALQTRLIALSAPAIVPAAPDPVAAPAPPTQETPPPAAEAPPRVPAVTPTLDRDSAVPRPQAPPPPSAPAPEPAAVVKPPSPVTPASPPVADANPVAAPPAPSVTYHGSTGLNPPPRPLSDIEQLVPEAAGARGGTVVLRMYINEQGGVDKAEVLQSSPPGLFDTTALEAASRARFSPGYLGGVPVKSQVTYEIRWGALGSGVETSGRTY